MIGATNSVAGWLFGGLMWAFYIVWLVLVIAGMWKTFVKAGHPGWGAIIPFYNMWIMVKMAGRTTGWFWIMLVLSLIPIVNIAAIIMLLITDIDISQNFGHGAGFGVLLWLFAPIMYLVLGFGSSQYRQVAHPEMATAGGGYAAPPPPPPPGQPVRGVQPLVPPVVPAPLTPPPTQVAPPPPAVEPPVVTPPAAAPEPPAAPPEAPAAAPEPPVVPPAPPTT